MNVTLHPSRPLAAGALALSLALGACSDATAPAATTSAPRAAVVPLPALTTDLMATVEWSGRWPALYIQHGDGSARTRVQFTAVHDRNRDNYSKFILPFTDSTIIALRWPKWSPNGQQLAVVAAAAYDEGAVLVMNADGRNIRIMSPNSQSVMSDVEWSPDGRYIAYVLNTGAFFLHPDLFVTDLVKDEVYRITTRGAFGPWDVFRFDESGRGIWFTEYEGWNGQEDGRVFRVNHARFDGTVDLTRERRLVGNPTALSRDGRTALVTRDIDSYTRALVRLGPGDREEETLDVGDVQWARFLEGDAELLVATHGPWDDPYSTPPLVFQLTGLTGGKDAPRTTLNTNPAAEVATYLRAGR